MTSSEPEGEEAGRSVEGGEGEGALGSSPIMTRIRDGRGAPAGGRGGEGTKPERWARDGASRRWDLAFGKPPDDDSGRIVPFPDSQPPPEDRFVFGNRFDLSPADAAPRIPKLQFTATPLESVSWGNDAAEPNLAKPPQTPPGTLIPTCGDLERVEVLADVVRRRISALEAERGAAVDGGEVQALTERIKALAEGHAEARQWLDGWWATRTGLLDPKFERSMREEMAEMKRSAEKSARREQRRKVKTKRREEQSRTSAALAESRVRRDEDLSVRLGLLLQRRERCDEDLAEMRKFYAGLAARDVDFRVEQRLCHEEQMKRLEELQASVQKREGEQRTRDEEDCRCWKEEMKRWEEKDKALAFLRSQDAEKREQEQGKRENEREERHEAQKKRDEELRKHVEEQRELREERKRREEASRRQRLEQRSGKLALMKASGEKFREEQRSFREGMMAGLQ